MDQTPTNLLIDYNTGEITAEIYDGDRLRISRQQQDEYAQTHIINFNKDKTFVKIYDEVVPLLEKYLTSPEFKFAICLSPHVSYEDCIIRESQNRNSRIIGIKDIAAVHGYTYNYAKKLFLSLKNKGIIGQHETGSILSNCPQKITKVYTVNPYVYFRGSDIITPVHIFYRDSGWLELLEGDTNSK